MSIDHSRILALHGICGYDDYRKQPMRLGWGVGTHGYVPMVRTHLTPLLSKTGCRRIFLHNPFPNSGEQVIPIDGPIRLKKELPAIYQSYLDGFGELRFQHPDVEVIEYHGAATQIEAPLKEQELADTLARMREIFFAANTLGHSIGLDLASSLKPTNPMAMIMPVLSMFLRSVSRRVYMEQRRRVEQLYMVGLPTITLYSEYQRQIDRGGEPALAPFDPNTENILLLDECPADRDKLESWDPWIIDQVEAYQADGFSVGVPTHSMIRRGRWDLLEQLFGKPADAIAMMPTASTPAAVHS